MIRLAAPLWLGLVALGVVAAVVWVVRRRWQRLPFPVAMVRSRRRGLATLATALSGLLAAAAFAPLAVALARPQEVLARRLERALGVDIAIALDISGSMAALDFRPSDRLGVAKEVISRFLDRRANDRFALVVFARAAVTVCPLTLDHDVATQLLDQASIGMLPDGTAIGLGLGTAVNRLRDSDAPSKVVILVTDGANNAGQLDPMSAADLARSEGITVHTVLVGSGGEVPIPVVRRDRRTGREVRTIERHEVETNPELLAEIARRTGGSSFRARDADALAEVFARIDALEKTEFTSTRLVRYRERFEPWALAALGLIVVAAVLEGALGRTPLVSFAEPWVLWLLALPAGSALLAVLRHHRRLGQQRRLASPSVWRRLMGGLPATGLARLLLWCGAAALVVAASARPQWGELPTEESVRTRDLVVALDVSDSMLCPDLPPSRLGRAIEVVKRLLPRLEGNRVGVVVFAGEAYPLVPLTTDLGAVATFLDTVVPGMVSLPGSNLEQAVAAALRLLPGEGEGRVVVLISDGENLQGDMEAAAEALRQAGVGVLAAVVGTEAGGPIPMPDPSGAVHYKRDRGGQPVVTRAQREVMAELSGAVSGEVLELGSRESVQKVAGAVEKLRTREVERTRRPERIERFPLFLAAAALLLAASFAATPWRRPAAALLGLLLVVAPAAAQQAPPPQGTPLPGPAAPAAADVADEAGAAGAVLEAQPSWWQRLIPGGSRRLARGGLIRWRAGQTQAAGQDFAAARSLAPEDPDRLFDLGTALGALGQIDQAGPVFEEAQSRGATAAAYNAGTASLQHGRAELAVGWLRQALLAAPDDPDARRNYELALRLLEQQQNQEQQQQQQQPQPQPTPTPSPGDGPPPTPTPDPNRPLYAALEQAEEEARDAMRTPTPQAVQVEKDW